MKSKHPIKTVKRETLPKQIAALAKKGNLIGALKLARGWELSADPARQIVETWLAVEALEKEPALEHNAPEGFCYSRLFERASLLTCSEVRTAVLKRDSEFFIRIAKRLKEAEPVRDKLRVAVLSDMLDVKMGVKGKTSTGIANEATGTQSDMTSLSSRVAGIAAN